MYIINKGYYIIGFNLFKMIFNSIYVLLVFSFESLLLLKKGSISSFLPLLVYADLYYLYGPFIIILYSFRTPGLLVIFAYPMITSTNFNVNNRQENYFEFREALDLFHLCYAMCGFVRLVGSIIGPCTWHYWLPGIRMKFLTGKLSDHAIRGRCV